MLNVHVFENQTDLSWLCSFCTNLHAYSYYYEERKRRVGQSDIASSFKY